MKYLLKIIAALCAITLFGFASLQFNDPDAIIWAGFYGICALVPSLLVFNKFSWRIFFLAVAMCCVQLVIAGPGAYQYWQNMDHEPLMQAMNPEKPYIEEAREFLGVLIALFIDLLSLVAVRRFRRK